MFRIGFQQNQERVISLQQWHDHFETLFSFKVDHRWFDVSSGPINKPVVIPQLDEVISLVELRVCIQYFMKLNKACGADGVHNNLLKWSMDWIAPILLNIFNAALRMEFTDVSWSEQILIPLFK